eukprot:CFRG6288T1
MNFLQMVVMSLAFAYYLFYTYTASRVFVQFWQNMRAFFIHNLLQVVFFTIYLIGKLDLYVLEVLISLYFVWLITLDTITIPLLRAIARKGFNVTLWGDIDFYGAHSRLMESEDLLERAITNEILRRALQDYANERYAGENIAFLVDIFEIRRRFLTKQWYAEEIKKVDMIVSDYICEEGACSLNLTARIRNECQRKYKAKTYDFEQIFTDPENEIKFLTTVNMWRDFVETPEYVQANKATEEEEHTNERIEMGLVGAGLLPTNDDRNMTKGSEVKSLSQIYQLPR